LLVSDGAAEVDVGVLLSADDGHGGASSGVDTAVAVGVTVDGGLGVGPGVGLLVVDGCGPPVLGGLG
jgi:hypothetical protein